MRVPSGWLIVTAGLVCLTAFATRAAAPDGTERWWQAGEGRTFPARLDYPDATGSLRLVLTGGPLDTRDHAFFAPRGGAGRACVTCHQPADGMSLSAASARARWLVAGANDPLFAAYDGSDCPDLPQKERDSHSLLLSKGLIRVARPWPPRNDAGKPIIPDFSIAVVRDPTGCNLSKHWGLASAQPTISVFRRVRPVGNFKYSLAVGFIDDPKSGRMLERDHATGQFANRNLMADGRSLTLSTQMKEAAASHLQFHEGLSRSDMAQILDFERRLYVAQQSDRVGGDVASGGAAGGADALALGEGGRLGDAGSGVWSEFAAWAQPDPHLSPDQRAFRQSVARGAKLFRDRTFLISDSAGINAPVGFGNPVRNGCAFCHNMSHTGMDVAPGQVDLGTTTLPFADPQPDLPLFRITCKVAPHPFYGRVIFTHDPGYALTTGKCADVGRITLQSLRGLAARAPYFSNGAAADLRGVVDFYDRRYAIHLTEQEKQDLVNLMSVL